MRTRTRKHRRSRRRAVRVTVTANPRRRHRRNKGTPLGYRRGVGTFIRRHRHINRITKREWRWNPPRRHRRRRSLSYYAGNPRRHRRNPYRVRHVVSRNPLKNALGNFKSMFNKDFLIDAASVAGGAIGTSFVTNWTLNKLGKSSWSVGPTGLAAQIVVAGLLGSIAGMMGKQRLARNIMLGGVASVVGQAANLYILPSLGVAPQPTASGNVAGLGNPAVRALVSREVKGYLSGGYLTPGNRVMSGMGAYAKPGQSVLSGIPMM
jgi:hypothetical protein